MREQEKEAFLEEEKTEEMTMGNYRDKASLAGEDDQQAESVKSEVVVDGSVDDHLQRFNKALKQFLDAVETFLDALESSSAATAHCGVRKVKQERKKKKFCQKTSKLSSCESQASSSKRKRVQEAHSSFEEKVPNIRESSLCHGEYVFAGDKEEDVKRRTAVEEDKYIVGESIVLQMPHVGPMDMKCLWGVKNKDLWLELTNESLEYLSVALIHGDDDDDHDDEEGGDDAARSPKRKRKKRRVCPRSPQKHRKVARLQEQHADRTADAEQDSKDG